MDFNKYISKTVRKNRDGLTAGITKYNNDTDLFTIIVKDIEYDVNAYNYEAVKIVYSKPTNNEYDYWTTSKGIPKKENYIKVSKYWSCIKDRQKVRGEIIDNIFIIKKY